MILEYENLKKQYEGNIKHLEDLCATLACENRYPDMYKKFQTKIEMYKWFIHDLETADLLYSMRKEIENVE